MRPVEARDVGDAWVETVTRRVVAAGEVFAVKLAVPRTLVAAPRSLLGVELLKTSISSRQRQFARIFYYI